MAARIGDTASLCAHALATGLSPGVPVIGLVGAGGKTSTMFALARLAAAGGRRVLVTTTTHILSPDTVSEHEGRGFGPLLLLPDPSSSAARKRIRAAGPRVVLAAERNDGDGKLTGIAPDAIPALLELFDVIFIEADGAKRRPIKAPSATEPVLSPNCTAVIGLIGLDAVNAPMDARSVHRPELFGPLTGCAPGERISVAHVLRLVSSPVGLFKSAPPSAHRLLLLNKIDVASGSLAAECARTIIAAAACDAVFMGATGKEPLP